MLRNVLFLLVASIPCITCQLVIGICPIMSRFMKDVDFERYSGQWYVIAQTQYHFMKGVKCQRVTYTPKGKGMTYSYSISKEDKKNSPHVNGTIKPENKNPGEFMIKLTHAPWSRVWYRIMYTDYEKIAVEYTCVDGTLCYMATISVLHRFPVRWPSLETGLEQFNITSLLTPSLTHYINMLDHTECENEQKQVELVL